VDLGHLLSKTMRQMRSSFSLIAVAWLASSAIAAEDRYFSVTLMGLDGQRSTLTLPELDALPRAKISVSQHGASLVFKGALLSDVLAKVDAPTGKAIRGIELSDVVVIEARDGYKVVLDLAGIDSEMRTERVILADRMDGSALDANVGPFQLVVEGDLRPARAVRMVSAIRLVRVR
jgi:hypothetical protein